MPLDELISVVLHGSSAECHEFGVHRLRRISLSQQHIQPNASLLLQHHPTDPARTKSFKQLRSDAKKFPVSAVERHLKSKCSTDQLALLCLSTTSIYRNTESTKNGLSCCIPLALAAGAAVISPGGTGDAGGLSLIEINTSLRV